MSLKSIFTSVAVTAAVFGLVTSAYAAPKGKDAPVTILVASLNFGFPHFVFMQEQIDDEAKTLGNVKVIAADGQLRSISSIISVARSISNDEYSFWSVHPRHSWRSTLRCQHRCRDDTHLCDLDLCAGIAGRA